MEALLSKLIERLGNINAGSARIIPWSCPVPAFGKVKQSVVATLGLNPSNREFVDDDGMELNTATRRLHTLKSLNLSRWNDATPRHVTQIHEACRDYFSGNPYNGWFRSLDAILAGANCTYYGESANACHLDLIPYATECKWTDLTTRQRKTLIDFAADSLAHLLRDSSIRILLLNGKTVVENMQAISDSDFDRVEMRTWTLPRKADCGVAGYAFRGSVSRLAGIDLGRPVIVLGYNHNIQSSFGVTSKVKDSIRRWFCRAVEKEVCVWDQPNEKITLAFASS